MREVEAYRRFKCVDFYIPHLPPAVLIRIWMIVWASEYHSHSREQSSVTSPQTVALNSFEDSAVVQDPDGEGKILYLFLPVFKVRLSNVVYPELTHYHTARKPARRNQRTHFPEKDIVRLFKGTCEAIRAMHDYRAPVGSQSRKERTNCLPKFP